MDGGGVGFIKAYGGKFWKWVLLGGGGYDGFCLGELGTRGKEEGG